MFSSKKSISRTGLKFRVVTPNMIHGQTDALKPARPTGRWEISSARPAVMVLALLCGAAIFDIQLVSPALAKSAKVSEADAAAAAKQEGVRSSYAKRKASVVEMLESGKRFDSDNRTSHTEFATAESMLREAEALVAANKYADGKDKLDRAYVLLKNTLRNMPSLKGGRGMSAKATGQGAAAAPVKAEEDPSLIEKKKQAYERLVSTTQSLTAALKQESAKAGVDNAEVFGQVESSSQNADRLAKSGDYDGAYQGLDAGYHVLTAAIVKLGKLKNNGAPAAKPLDAGVSADATEREYVAREIESSKALLAMLKHLNEDKVSGKEKEIAALKATADEAGVALQGGDVALAKNLIQDANSRSKKAIASLQTLPDKVSGSSAPEAVHHANDDKTKDLSARNGYAKHKESVVVLLQAGRRVDSERRTSHAEFDKAESMLKEADALAAAKSFDKGHEQLDRTYVLIKNTMRTILSAKGEPR